jgi:putative oxidoreductase
MAIARRLARPLLASIFIYGGIDAVRNPASKVAAADKVVADVPAQIPGLSTTEQLVRVDGAVKVIAGLALGLGKFPRLAALALIASLLPTTAAGHRFWEEQDPAKRKAQTLHFVKNASIAGGLILAAVDTEGKPSVGWRARRAAHNVIQSVGPGASTTGALAAGAAAVSHLASAAAQSVPPVLESAGELAQTLGAVLSEKAHDLTDSAQQLLPS